MISPAQIKAAVIRATQKADTPDLTPNTESLRQAIRRLWADGYVTGVHAANESTGNLPALGASNIISFATSTVDWNTWTPGDPEAAMAMADGGLADLLNQANIVIKGISDTTLGRMGDLIGEGLAQGSSVDSISGMIDQYLNDPARADMIATTEANRAQTTAQSDTLQAVGFSQFDWIAYDGACDECMDQEDNNPHDFSDDQPPGHPNCRCSITGAGDVTIPED